MSHNHYDDPDFFNAYAQMRRSREGLAGAGEWQAFRQILPDFSRQEVLDLGCGYGWHCRYAAENGASKVIGVDLSEKMLAVARKQNAAPVIQYQQGAIEDTDFPLESFDVIMSSLAFHYVADFSQLMAHLQKMLKPAGRLVFSMEHPVFTARGAGQDWIYDEEGEIRFFPVDDYFFEGIRETTFLGSDVTKYHHTLTTIFTSLLTNGFEIEEVVEPQPPKEMLGDPGMKEELRRPMMLIIKARKGSAPQR